MKTLIQVVFTALAVLLALMGVARSQGSPSQWVAQLRSPDPNVSEAYVPDAIDISGLVADEDARHAIHAEALRLFPFGSINDAMKVGRGGVDATTAIFGLQQLARLREGRIQINSRTLQIFGQAKTNENVQALTTEIRNKLPPGLNLSAIDIAPPLVTVFTWSISRTPTSVHLNGFVPSNAVKNKIYADAMNRFGQATVEDSSVVATGRRPTSCRPQRSLSTKWNSHMRVRPAYPA